MKKFENPRLRVEYVNVYGETMTLVLDREENTWIHHNDGMEDFRLLEIKTNNIVSDFIVSNEEGAVIVGFDLMCKVNIDSRS